MSNLKLKISQRSRWLYRGTYKQTDHLFLFLPQTLFLSENRWIEASTWLSNAATNAVQASITRHSTGTALHWWHSASHTLVTELSHSSILVATAHSTAARTSIATHRRRHRIIDRGYPTESIVAHLLTLLMSITPKLLAMHVVASVFIVLIVVVRMFFVVEAIASRAKVVVVRQVAHLLTLSASFRHLVIALVHILIVIAEVSTMMGILSFRFRLGLGLTVSLTLCFRFGS